LRLQGTAANQVISTATLALIKKSNDTIAQSLRLQGTAANQVISTATLALIKKSNDTIAQNTRSINTAITNTLSSFVYDKIKKISTSVTTSADAYTSGDNIGGIITLAAVARQTGGSAELYEVSIFDQENQKPNLVIDFYSASPSGTYTDAAAQVMAGDGGVWLGSVQVASANYATQGAIARFTVSKNLLSVFCTGSANTAYYMTISTTSTPTWASANGLIIKTTFKQD
jgi:hypothetical protein